MLDARLNDRLLAAAGVASVVLGVVGEALISKVDGLGDTSSTHDIAQALSSPVVAGTWAGAYLTVISFACFIAFALWACTKLGGGLYGQIGRAAALAYATLDLVSLAAKATLAHEAGHGIAADAQLVRTVGTLIGALYVTSFFMVALFLLAAGALALTAARRRLGWSAIAIALYTLVAVPLSVDNLGQDSILLFFLWTIAASIALARRTRERIEAPAVAQRA